MPGRGVMVINALSALTGGARNFLRSILSRLPPDWEHTVIVLADTRSASSFAVPGCDVVECRPASGSVLRRTLWEQTQLPSFLRRVSANLLFSPGGIMPRGVRCRTALVWQNMLPFQPHEMLRYGLSKQLLRLLLLRGAFANSIRRADLVFCLSDFARKTIERVVSRRVGDIVVVSHGVSDAFRQDIPTPPAGFPAEYFLYVSTIDVYKAHLQVVDAWRLYKEKSRDRAAMVFVGSEYQPYAARVRRRVAQYGLQESILFAGWVDHEVLPGIYAAARAHVFASSCENCPTILLEQLASGRPVICSRYDPMPEFGGVAAVYFDPYDPGQLAELLLRWRELEAYGSLGQQRSREYSWDRTASVVWEELAKLMETPMLYAPQRIEPPLGPEARPAAPQ